MAQTFGAELVRCARTVARLQARKRQLRRELKRIDADLRVEKRNLKALLAATDTAPDVMPSRLFGDGVGHRRTKQAPPAVTPVEGAPLVDDCTDSPACAARGCADCERAYGPTKEAK